jgi:hypothetical protein
MTEPTRDGTPDPEEAPPILGSWPRLYALVIGVLAAQMVIYWIITKVFE